MAILVSRDTRWDGGHEPGCGDQRLAALVGEVIDRRAITTVFQPLVDLETNGIVGYEALSRGPLGTEVEPPLKLLEGAGLTGRLAEFDWMCASAACEAALAAKLHPSMTIFVNIKPSTVSGPCPNDLRPAVHRAQHNLRLVVDMKEDDLTGDPASLFDAVRAVRDFGWGISIDGAAADPTALALLPLVRPDVLKLEFRGGCTSLYDLARMSDGARVYAEETGATILVQGLENHEDVMAARLTGATFGQGWHFGRPGPLPPERVLPTSVFPFVQCLPEVDRRSPFEILTERTRPTVTEKRFLAPFTHHIEEQVDTNGPPALLLETFEPGAAQLPEAQLRLRAMQARAAFLAVLGTGAEGPAPDGPNSRYATVDPNDPVAGEWNTIVLGPHHAVGVTARPLEAASAGESRRYEYAITHDREVIVRAAAALWQRLPPAGLRRPS